MVAIKLKEHAGATGSWARTTFFFFFNSVRCDRQKRQKVRPEELSLRGGTERKRGGVTRLLGGIIEIKGERRRDRY